MAELTTDGTASEQARRSTEGGVSVHQHSESIEHDAGSAVAARVTPTNADVIAASSTTTGTTSGCKTAHGPAPAAKAAPGAAAIGQQQNAGGGSGPLTTTRNGSSGGSGGGGRGGWDGGGTGAPTPTSPTVTSPTAFASAASAEELLLLHAARVRDPSFYKSLGFDRPVGRHTAGLLSRVSFSWVAPLLVMGSRGKLREPTARAFMPPEDDAEVLAAQFWAAHGRAKERAQKKLRGRKLRQQQQQQPNLLSRSLLRLHWRCFLEQLFWCCAESSVRVVSPVVLRFLVRWVSLAASGSGDPVWQGWLLALALGCSGFAYMVFHHCLFWIGMHTGFVMRQQVIAAIYEKVMRLNLSTISVVSIGKVINLVSNDVRRLDDSAVFWPFLLVGPLELGAVFALVAVVLGVLPALAGVSVLLLMMPVQGMLTRYIKYLRANTARCTDARVRLASEVISGALAMKMLGWEKPFGEELMQLRRQEVRYSSRMAKIRAANMALEFAVAPLASFCTFAVARATSADLSVWNVFFALSLLHLPKLYLATFFVRAIEVTSELYVGLQRINEFLETPEPPPALQLPATSASAAPASDAGDGGKGAPPLSAASQQPAVVFRGADFDWEAQKQLLLNAGIGAVGGGKGGVGGEKGGAWAKAEEGRAGISDGKGIGGGSRSSAAEEAGKAGCNGGGDSSGIDGAGGRFSLDSQAGGGGSLDSAAAGAAAAAAAGPTLKSILLQVPRGQLVGITGEVGSGKSSLLDALLGELQPLEPLRETASETAAPAAAVAAGLPMMQLTTWTAKAEGVGEEGAEGGDAGQEEGERNTSLPSAAVAIASWPGGGGGYRLAQELAPCVSGSVSYCSQVPWIVGGSLRDNVLFGLPYDEARYSAAISCSALDEDLEQLPAGDRTELGEHGINLSGGQKARVALARAAYSRARVALLDDPLSAVDPRVGRRLFHECIGPTGIMAGSTRLLVTHQRQYLPHCDRVIVLRAGAVAADGTHAELVTSMGMPEIQAAGTAAVTDGGAVQADRGAVQADGGAVQADRGAVQADGAAVQADGAAVQADGGAVPPREQTVSASALAATGGTNGANNASAVSAEPTAAPTAAPAAEPTAAVAPLPTAAPAVEMVEVNGDGVGMNGSSTTAAPRGSGHGHSAIGAAPSPSSSAAAAAARVGRRVGSSKLRQSLSVLMRGGQGGEAAGALQPHASQARGMGLRMASRYLPGMEGAHASAAAAATVPSATPAPDQGPTARLRTDPVDWARGVALRAAAAIAPSPSRKGGGCVRRPWRRGGVGGSADGGDSVGSGGSSSNDDDGEEGGEQGGAGRQKGGGGGGGGKSNRALRATRSGRLVAREGTVTGGVSWRVWFTYMRYIGLTVMVLLMVGMVAGQVAFIGSEYWLATWAKQSPEDQQSWYWVWGYSIFVGAVVAISIARAFLFYVTTLRAATSINSTMVARVLRAPLRFFHTNPTGRVLNRFSKDQGIADEVLPQVLFDALQSMFMVGGAFVLVSWAVPVILPTFVPLAVLFVYVRQRYVATSREVKRLEAATRSPVYANFSATLKGLSTIRAYGATSRFFTDFCRQLDTNGAWWYCFIGSARWVGFRLDLIAASTLLFACLLIMAMHGSVSPRLAGLALTHVLQLSGTLQWMVRQTAEAENNMTSVERMIEYTQLESEPPTVEEGGGAPPPGWPSAGTIEYQDVTASYRPGLPPVLNSVSFVIKGGTSCGVVGRTGSGKSSLMLSLFRLIDIRAGRVLIDGLDTASVGLDALRRQLSIIPQDPVLFSGTLRSNLDPWQQHPDSALWQVLGWVKLRAHVRALGGLDARMADAGSNLSVGQRQLFCLARALLQDAAVLALDEATANVDRTTDALIQTALRAAVSGSDRTGGRRRTLLVIAHRIDTILDCHQLLVLSAGRLAESGPPAELAARPGGVFAGMAAAAAAAGGGGTAEEM